MAKSKKVSAAVMGLMVLSLGLHAGMVVQAQENNGL